MPRRISHLGPKDMVRQLNTSIESLDMATSLQYAEAYLHFVAEARPLMEVLALATSKTHDNPHHHKIMCTALEEYTLSTPPRGSELLLTPSAHLSAVHCLRDCYELYAKYFPGWVRCLPCEGEVSSPCRRTSEGLERDP